MIKIKLYGQPTSAYEYIKERVIHYAKDKAIAIEITEVQKLEELIAENIESIPTLKINDQVILQLGDGNISEFVKRITMAINNINIRMQIREILIPMDFDEVSINALKYVLSCFPFARITIVHAFSGLLDLKDPLILLPAKLKENALHDFIKSFILEELNTNYLPGAIHKITSLTGPTVSSVLKYESQNRFDLVTMGTRKRHDLFDRWLGSVSTLIARKARAPVLLIPPNATCPDTFIKTIIAIDDIGIHKVWNKYMDGWNNSNGKIHLVHVTTNGSNASEKKVHLQKKLKALLLPFAYEVSVLTGHNVVDTLLSHAQLINAQQVIVFPRNRNRFQELMYQNVSGEIIRKTAVPVYFIHPGTLEA